MKQTKLILLLVLLVLVFVFALQNVATVEIQFLLWSVETSRALMLFLVFGIGILLGWIGCSLNRRR